MAQPYVPGPVDLWLGIGAGGAPVFFGHCEKGFDLQKRPRWGELICDLAGSVPMDEYFEGADALLSGTLIRYNETTYRSITDFSAPRLAVSIPGLELPGDIGALAISEECTYMGWLRHPYSVKLVFNDPISGAMVPGYRMMAMRLERDSIPDLGPRPKKLPLTWRCLRVFDFNYRDNLGQGRFILYDHDLTALPAGFA